MKTVKHEIKLERSVKIILAVFAVGIFLNAFATPISKELFGIKEAKALGTSEYDRLYIECVYGCR
mgnify:CR=1 FL=1|jgi:hypothetical protein